MYILFWSPKIKDLDPYSRHAMNCSLCRGTEAESRLLVQGKVSVWVGEFRLALREVLSDSYAMQGCQLYCFCSQVNLRHSLRLKPLRWRRTSQCCPLIVTPPTALHQSNVTQWIHSPHINTHKHNQFMTNPSWTQRTTLNWNQIRCHLLSTNALYIVI